MHLPPPYASPPRIEAFALRRGKVRDLYQTGGGELVIVASDRISAFDVVLTPGIPGKGVVLTQLSSFWFSLLADVAPSHLLATDANCFPEPFASCTELAGRACLVRPVRIVPIECVVRGYLVGSGWKEYRATGTICGIRLPTGMQLADRLPEAVFTPSTKAEVGHDENISFDATAAIVGGDVAERLRSLSLALYSRAAAYAESRGIIIADTKFEFGIDDGGALVWADEALTPDSSRFWPAAEYRPGANPPSFDKQFVRDWLEASGWSKQPPAPTLPAAVVEGTLGRYLEAFRRLTGRELSV
jgi:phosphoribosylaminoimidazole-succinocarboxamide synthase